MDVVLCEPARSTELWAWLMILHGSGYFEVGGFHRRTTLETCDRDTGTRDCMLSEVPAPAFLENFCGKLNQHFRQRMQWSSRRGRSKDAG
jgi:hypothetical protein